MKVAFISDIHEDVVSLSVALNKIRKLSADKIICLGDIAGYNFKYYDYHHTRNASECLKMLRDNCDIIVPGNHDYHAIKRIPEISPGFDFPPEWYELDHFRKKEIADRRLWDYDDADLHPKLRSEDADFLSKLNEYEILETENYDLLLSHYVFPNLSGMLVDFYRNSEDFNLHFDFMRKNKCMGAVTGHEHMPGFSCVGDNRVLIKGMGKKQTCSTPFILMAPSVADGRNKSGFMILDTITNKAMSYRI